MNNFYELTQVNGFDTENLLNARQNNYAWSMSELDGYIYVGTGRNILYNIVTSLFPGVQLPALINVVNPDNHAEIWRYKKNETQPWQLVYKSPESSGFRFMLQHIPFGGSPALYAAGLGATVQVVKSTNGVNWFILPNAGLTGTSSRAMVTHRGKLYLATINETAPGPSPLLYSSPDPEFIPWKLETDPAVPGFLAARNPQGAISNMAVFNNRIYVATSTPEGAQVWRTNGPEPQVNEWTLIVDKGFGDPANIYTLAIGVFKDYLYVSGTKELPQAWAIPRGCDIIRIDKRDNWELVVGGNPFLPSSPLNSPFDVEIRTSLSGLGSGFNNPFNVYAWQIQEFQGRLLISTFDDSSNMEVILTTLLANRTALSGRLTAPVVDLLIAVYTAVVEILRAIRYPMGFDLYVSDDGVHFDSLFLNGLHNHFNYGGRILFVDSRNRLYLGTANPFQGCEVWKALSLEDADTTPCCENHYERLWKTRQILLEKYDVISESMPAILEVMQKGSLQKPADDSMK